MMTPRVPQFVTFNVFGEKCLDMAGAAKRLKISRAAIFLACQTHRLKHFRVEGRIYIPIAAIDAYKPDPKALVRGKAAADKKAKAKSERGRPAPARPRRRLPAS